jgi:hypothetical protein
MRMLATGTAQAAGTILFLLQAQSAISFSRETYFIMKSSGIAILSKAEIVFSGQVSSTVVALSGIHE